MAEKEIVRTERAPAPFQGAPYNQAVRAAASSSSPASSGSQPGGAEMVGAAIAEQTEQVMRTCARSSRRPAAASTGSSRRRSSSRPRRLRRHERGLRAPRRRPPPARSTVEVAKLPSGALVEIEAIVAPDARARSQNGAVWDSVADYVRSLGLDAYLVGGAVRDELLGHPARDPTSSSPGSATPSCGRRSSRTAGSRTSSSPASASALRLLPRDRDGARAAPAGIEFAPPRVERSTGPGRHDFEIVADAAIPLEQDMERRDFTINAIAKRLATGELLDPLGGRDDLERGVLRTTSPTSFRDDPLRIVRGLRFVSQLGLEPDADTLAQMREWAPQVGSSRASGSAAGSRPTGWASCRSCCSARTRRRRCGWRATRACSSQCSPSSSRAIGYDRAGRPAAPAARRAHLRGRPGGGRRGRAARGAARGAAARPRQAARRERDGRRTRELGAEHRRSESCAGCATRRGCGSTSSGSCASTRSIPKPRATPSRRAASSRGTASGSRSTWSPTSAADLRAKDVAESDVATGRALPRRSSSRSASSPHRLGDLAVDGTDLIALGFARGRSSARACERCWTTWSRIRRGTTASGCSSRARELRVIRWEPPGPYVVVFSTRAAA